jgi:16S rRNA (guanine527-N7)-methyltransferase
MNPKQQLASGAKQLNIQAGDKQLGLLLQYVGLLQKWNQTYNLTAIEDTNEIISKHILDSLSVAKYLDGKNIIDVGSGAGLPGIPLAIICPEKQFTLLDSNVKKTRFIQQAVIDLGLKNVQTLHQRVEEFRSLDQSNEGITTEFNIMISRAFAASDKLFISCEPVLNFLTAKGRIIFMLGKQNHLEVLPNGYNVVDIRSIEIPTLEAQRHIAIVERK